MPNYSSRVFEVHNITEAKAIILTPEGESTDVRWERETPVLAAQLTRELSIDSSHLVLDYGCGIGRLAKALITMQVGCSVLGADISLSMMQLAPRYVLSQRFCTFHPTLLDTLIAQGIRFDSAYSVWVIQHCAEPEQDLRRIRAALKPGGKFHLVNTRQRCVPTDEGWVNDGIDVIEICRSLYREIREVPVPPELAPPDLVGKYMCLTCET